MVSEPVTVSIAEGWSVAHIHGWVYIIDGVVTDVFSRWDYGVDSIVPTAGMEGATLRVRVQVFNNENRTLIEWFDIYSAQWLRPLRACTEHPGKPPANALADRSRSTAGRRNPGDSRASSRR